jgi:glycine/D-amino acid oxidase-like deaminating enzyme
MTRDSCVFDAVVIGGGFYGAAIAIYLAQKRGLSKVLLLERESALLTRASYNNQARVHNGYHYPRSFTTGYRSRVNLSRFVRDWPEAVKRDFVSLYAVARGNSKVTAKQFERFCGEIGASLRCPDSALRGLFDPRLVEGVFLVEEYAFDSVSLARWAVETLQASRVEVCCNALVTGIRRDVDGVLEVAVRDKGEAREIGCRYAFNCTYSGLNQLAGDVPGTRAELKQEIAELALVDAPSALRGLAVTVIDGPYFSMMPFPARGLHTLSHVRYTPHLFWQDRPGLDPYQKLADYERASRVERMIRDAARFLPAIHQAKRVDSIFEVKTVLIKNEADDGRPILFEKSMILPGYFAVLGAKIDNIYDVLERLDGEDFGEGSKAAHV